MAISADQARQVFEKSECCYTHQEVGEALDIMASDIKAVLQDKNPLLLCVMNGGLIAMAQLLLRLPFPLQYDYIHATRYQGETQGSELNWVTEPSAKMKNRHVLIVDDILDEGLTMAAIIEYCQLNGAASVYTAVLVNKKHDRKSLAEADFTGLQVSDRYVFGYGMDYKGYLRNLNGIYAVVDE